MSHRDDKAKFAAPVSPHSCLRIAASAGRLVGTVNVGGNFNEINQKVWNIRDEPFADVFQFERDVL
jgi:hypothetical protein